MVDAPTGHSINTKAPDEAYQLIEVMAFNDYRAPSKRILPKKAVMELDTLDAILTQNTSLSQQVMNLTKKIDEMQANSIHSTLAPQ